jgi:hypothetical protein
MSDGLTPISDEQSQAVFSWPFPLPQDKPCCTPCSCSIASCETPPNGLAGIENKAHA